LAAIPGIIGVKEASGDIGQMGDVIREIAIPGEAEGRPFTVLSGDDALTLPLLALGGDGVVSVLSNLVPAAITALVHACLEGNYEEGRRLHYTLLPLFKAAFVETNPVPIKAAMTWAGLPGGPVRLPLGRLGDPGAVLLRKVMRDLGIALQD
ncbi:MAG: dihydrodipicolinate synthase family protein, partial [Treponema sp.]|nr:dihydrodipicolinate synthase family protein [Treponema sp.]